METIQAIRLLLLPWLGIKAASPTFLPSHDVKVQEYCYKEPFQARCPEHEVLVMQVAVYGRMNIGRCVSLDFGFIGCSADVLNLMDPLCSGRHSCEIPNINTVLDYDNPCLELTRYLEAAFTCLKVTLPRPRPASCEIDAPIIEVSQPGYLANVISESSPCGTKFQPWVLTVQPSQRINLTLVDFGTGVDDVSGAMVCLDYASVREPELGQSWTTICGGNGRTTHAFLSSRNRVEIKMTTPSLLQDTHFLLKYETVGCREPKFGKNMKLIRHQSNVAVIGCTTSAVTWKLECRDNRWQGNMANCSGAHPQAQKFDDMIQDIITSLPNGVAILLIVGISLCISVTILIIGLLCLKRRREASRPGAQAIPLHDTLLPEEHKHTGYGYYDPGGKLTIATTATDVRTQRGHMGSRNDYEYSYSPGYEGPPPYGGQADSEAYNVEHIYESPVFVRREREREREKERERERERDETVQYFELDPENSRHINLCNGAHGV